MRDKALTKAASSLFSALPRFSNFYLVGGTALALQIGHRLSVDLDLFSREELPANLLPKVKSIFRGYSIFVTYRSTDQLNLVVNNVKVTFFHFPYPVIKKYVMYRDMRMACVQEVAAMKAFSIGKRLVYKDYVDWYFLLKEKHVELKDVLKISQKKFGGDFNDRLFLGQLVSFEDISIQKIDFLDKEVDRKTVERFLEQSVRSFVKTDL